MQYIWSNVFNISDALAGTVVGFPQNGGGVGDYDLSKTGRLVKDTEWTNPPYKVIIDGIILRVDNTGLVISSNPSSNYVGYSLWMVTLDMGSDNSIGSSAGMTRSPGSGHSSTATIDKMEPRDYFAVDVLNAMIVHMNHPEAVDDATMMMYSRAAYRWAQAMMTAAADSREGDYSSAPATVDVDTKELQSNTEKILYNISASLASLEDALEDGIPVIGVSGGQTLGVEVTNSSPIEVNASNIPTTTINGVEGVKSYVINDASHPAPVTVQNQSDINVNVNNSSPIEITGEVEIVQPSE